MSDLDRTQPQTQASPFDAIRQVRPDEREEKARRMHREVALLFEHDPIGRLIAARLRHEVEDES